MTNEILEYDSHIVWRCWELLWRMWNRLWCLLAVSAWWRWYNDGWPAGDPVHATSCASARPHTWKQHVETRLFHLDTVPGNVSRQAPCKSSCYLCKLLISHEVQVTDVASRQQGTSFPSLRNTVIGEEKTRPVVDFDGSGQCFESSHQRLRSGRENWKWDNDGRVN